MRQPSLPVYGMALSGIIFIGFGILFVFTSPQNDIVVTESITTLVDVPSGVTPEVTSPVRLQIPSLGVDALVQSVGIEPVTKTMAVPNNFNDVGWYNEGPKPGEKGSAVMTGHRSGRYVPRGIFYNLHTIAVGDVVFVETQDNETLTFVVVKVAEYEFAADTTEIFRSSDGISRLNLITCSGLWDSVIGLFTKRVVVYTERAESPILPD